jgi:ferredoxin-NADP reductase
MSTPMLTALVKSMRHEADGVVSLELRPAEPGTHFPAFEAGSHIDVHLPNALVRSYSLLNPETDCDRYVIAVLLDRSTRGGSRCVHEQLRVGMSIPISAPRNNFCTGSHCLDTVLQLRLPFAWHKPDGLHRVF